MSYLMCCIDEISSEYLCPVYNNRHLYDSGFGTIEIENQRIILIITYNYYVGERGMVELYTANQQIVKM